MDEKWILNLRIRQSTFDRLVFLQNGLLTKLLENAMKNEPISPVLDQSHFLAIERRMPIILQTIQTCVDKLVILFNLLGTFIFHKNGQKARASKSRGNSNRAE